MVRFAHLQAGNVVRLRSSIALMPLNEDAAPSEIPAGTLGHITRFVENEDGVGVQVTFAEPYNALGDLPLRAEWLQLMIPFSLN